MVLQERRMIKVFLIVLTLETGLLTETPYSTMEVCQNTANTLNEELGENYKAKCVYRIQYDI